MENEKLIKRAVGLETIFYDNILRATDNNYDMLMGCIMDMVCRYCEDTHEDIQKVLYCMQQAILKEESEA